MELTAGMKRFGADMAGPYVITTPVPYQPIPSAGFGQAVKDAISDLDARTSVLETGSQAIIKRGRRVTASTGSTGSEVGVLRVDNIPVRSGKIYRVSTAGINLSTTVNNDVGSARFRVAYAVGTGTVANLSSTQIGQMRNTIDVTNNTNVIPGQCFYVASADGYISIMLTVQRIAGSGTVTIYAVSPAEPLDLVIEYAGTDPGDTGVII